MSPSNPISPVAKPIWPMRTSSSSSKGPTSHPQPLNSPTPSTGSTSTSPPTTPRTPISRSPTTETTIFARIRSARSRSPSARSPTAIPRSNSSPTASPTTEEYPHRARLHLRTESSQSANQISRPRSRSNKRHSGTVMQCGRHSNDWLFGGFSFTDTVRGFVRGGDDGKH
ncbi:hypothetical protein MMC30_001696 [Trapelia coarctata]|nr:hypothetical protein [Trapelia coarctata]